MCIHTDIWDNVGINDNREAKVCASTFPGTACQTEPVLLSFSSQRCTSRTSVGITIPIFFLFCNEKRNEHRMIFSQAFTGVVLFSLKANIVCLI